MQLCIAHKPKPNLIDVVFQFGLIQGYHKHCLSIKIRNYSDCRSCLIKPIVKILFGRPPYALRTHGAGPFAHMHLTFHATQR